MFKIITLPKGWSTSTIHEIAKNIQYGYTESSSKNIVGPKFLRITDIQEKKVNWKDVPYCKISETEIANYLLQDGDLLFARTGATVGKSYLIKGSIPTAIFASYLIRLRFPKEIIDNFVWYYFQSPLYWTQIVNNQVGTGQPNVNGTILGKVTISIPPLPEQHRIVAKIEELFSSLDKGIESLKKAQQQLKVYRQAVLKYAFEGRLTNPKLQEEELPEGWVVTTLGQVTIKSSEKVYPDKSSTFDFLGMDSIEPHTTKPIVWHRFSEMKSAGNKFKVNQVLYGRMRPYLNKTYLADRDGVASGEFIVLDCNNILPIYLLNILHHRDFVQFANSKTTGDRPRVTYDELTDYKILLPNPEEQRLIVQEIESRLSICDKIEENIAQSLQQAEALRQSILKKAFEGMLVPQEPSDEPASVMLERIKAERENSITQKPKKTVKTKTKKEKV
jgi:type I restriction enzyme S subunit